MQVKIFVTEDEFSTGNLLNKKSPPVVEYIDSDGWTRRLKLTDVDKCVQFSEVSRQFLSALKDTVDIFSE